MSRHWAWALAALVTIALSGCQTTQQRSAELEKHAKHEVLATKGISVTKESRNVQVLESSVVHSGAGTAVVVRMRNRSAEGLRNAPIAITVRDAHGSVLFQNDQPGLDPSLTQVPWLAPHAEAVWVDDQITATGTPASASALVGEGEAQTGNPPSLSVSAPRLSEEGGETIASGTVTNRSQITQEHLVVYAIAKRGEKIVAAGRAILPETLPGKAVPFQVYFIGDPHGATLRASAPPASF